MLCCARKSQFFTHLSKDSDDVMSDYDDNDYAAVATVLEKMIAIMTIIPMTLTLNTEKRSKKDEKNYFYALY